MIRFKCRNCGQGFKVSEEHAGKQTKCPKCNSTVVVPKTAAQAKPPEQPEIIKFHCPSCNQKIGLAKQYAGKTVRCAKCKNSLQVPGAPRPAAPPKPTRPKHETEILRAGQEDALSTEGLWGDLGDMEPLRLAEETAPSVEMPQQATAQEVPGAENLAAYDSALPGGGFYRDTIAEEPSQARPGLIIGLGCGVTLLIAGVVFLIFILSMASSFSEGIVESPEAEELVEQFIYLIEDKKNDEAKSLFAEELQGGITDSQVEQFERKVAKSEIVQLECSQIRIIEEEQRLKLFVEYDVYFMDPDEMENLEDYANQANVIALLFKDNEELKLESIAASDFSGGSASVGKSSYDQLSDAMTSIVTDKLKSKNWGLPCSVLIVLVIMVLIVGIIQTVAVWAIFERAGQPGWAILVPFYNMWVWAEVGDRPGWVGLASYGAAFIPYVGELAQLGIWIYITIGVAKAFDRSVGFGLGLCFLPIVFYPILAFDG